MCRQIFTETYRGQAAGHGARRRRSHLASRPVIHSRTKQATHRGGVSHTYTHTHTHSQTHYVPRRSVVFLCPTASMTAATQRKARLESKGAEDGAVACCLHIHPHTHLAPQFAMHLIPEVRTAVRRPPNVTSVEPKYRECRAPQAAPRGGDQQAPATQHQHRQSRAPTALPRGRCSSFWC